MWEFLKKWMSFYLTSKLTERPEFSVCRVGDADYYPLKGDLVLIDYFQFGIVASEFAYEGYGWPTEADAWCVIDEYIRQERAKELPTLTLQSA